MFIPPPQELGRTELPFNRSNQSSFTKTLHRKHNEKLTCSVEDRDVRSIAQQLYYLNPPFISTRKYNQSTPRHSELLPRRLATKSNGRQSLIVIAWPSWPALFSNAQTFSPVSSLYRSTALVGIKWKTSPSTPTLYCALVMTLADGNITLLPLAFDCFGSQS